MTADSPIYNFLKKRRTNEFSDSTVKVQGKLTRELFDFYLNSLTSRSQEKDFEIFCRRIMEIEICPNLLPQTGPTGGGDSKVDSETYPVSEATALTWYHGIGNAAAKERWAFAISAKKAWRPKCISDIEKIVNTGRGYKEIFFITNQYVSDKKRAELEDLLSNKYGIGVHILDKTWILEKVFTNRHENIAIDTLHLSVELKEEKVVGPLDYSRTQELDKAEKEISNYIAQGNYNLHLVEKAIEAAILSKEMELPLFETKGRFLRAINLANEYGTGVQMKEVSYEWAWGVYWWYNSQDEYKKAYSEYEALVLDSNLFYDVERLTNLWMNLVTLYGGDLNDPLLKEKTATLIGIYNRLIEDTSRPSTSLQSKVSLIFVRMFTENHPPQLFADLEIYIEEALGCLDFSFRTISKMIIQLSDFFLDNAEYDSLFEKLIGISATRTEEIDSAKMLLSRGKSFYPQKPYTAIKYIGRALIRLYKSESKKLLTEALIYMGLSFAKIGLYWAAYGYFSNAIFLMIIDYMQFGNISPLLLMCADQLRAIELQCGLIAYSLQWHNIYTISKSLVHSTGYKIDAPELIKTDQIYDGILGVYFLNLQSEDLLKLTKLPDNLDRLDLLMGAMALRYTLGYIDEELADIYTDSAALDEYMGMWKNQPATEHLSKTIIYGKENSAVICSNILGCSIEVTSDLIFPCIEFSKTILASLEAFMATGMQDRIIARYHEVNIIVKYLDSEYYEPKFGFFDKNGKLWFEFSCSSYSENEFQISQTKTKTILLDFIAQFVPRAFMFSDSSLLERMASEDKVLERSLEFTSSIFAIDDLLGRDVINMDKWIQPDSKEYPRQKIVSMHKKDSDNTSEKSDSLSDLKVHYGAPDGYEPENLKHSDIKMNNLINLSLWDNAGWRGVLYLISPESHVPAILAPLFSNEDAAIGIFKKWIEDFGKADLKKDIRCCIIRGVDKTNPMHYRVAFSPNINNSNLSESNKYIISPSRFHLMESTDNSALNYFLKRTSQLNNSFYLAPAVVTSMQKQPDVLYDLVIRKNNLETIDSWQIGVDSWWSFAILPDDNPIIPKGVDKAPITELLNKKRHK